RINGSHDPALGIEDEAGRLETDRIVIDKGACDCGNGSCVGAVADREAELVLFDERLRLFLIVHRYRDDLNAFGGKFVHRSCKSGKLGVAVGTPGTAVEQNHAEAAGQIARQIDLAAAGTGKGKRGKDITILQHHNALRFERLSSTPTRTA